MPAGKRKAIPHLLSSCRLGLPPRCERPIVQHSESLIGLGLLPSIHSQVYIILRKDVQFWSHCCRREPLSDRRSRLGVNFTAAHSSTTFFGISIFSDLRPKLRSSRRV